MGDRFRINIPNIPAVMNDELGPEHRAWLKVQHPADYAYLVKLEKDGGITPAARKKAATKKSTTKKAAPAPVVATSKATPKPAPAKEEAKPAENTDGAGGTP